MSYTDYKATNILRLVVIVTLLSGDHLGLLRANSTPSRAVRLDEVQPDYPPTRPTPVAPAYSKTYRDMKSPLIQGALIVSYREKSGQMRFLQDMLISLQYGKSIGEIFYY